MLDQLGDESSHKERRAHFRQVDADNSNCIDFGEFLELVHNVTHGTTTREGLGQTYVGKIMAASQCNHLDIVAQAMAGII
jgi:hypothetical protein